MKIKNKNNFLHKRRAIRSVSIIALVVFAILLVWLGRGSLRDAWYRMRQPALPSPTTFRNGTLRGSLPVASTVTRKSKPASVLIQATGTGALASSDLLPESVNLAVPFLLQAPTHDWSLPYQEACEEAASIMVDAYYRGRTTKFGEQEGDKAILDIIAFEKTLLGKYEDTSATETARLITAYFHYSSVVVGEVTSLDQIKTAVALKHPVLVPVYGKALQNPYFRNGGPLYHMLVIKGYLSDGRFIANDAGIGKGADYLYSSDILWNAMHDWNDGDVQHGKRMMLVVFPNT